MMNILNPFPAVMLILVIIHTLAFLNSLLLVIFLHLLTTGDSSEGEDTDSFKEEEDSDMQSVLFYSNLCICKVCIMKAIEVYYNNGRATTPQNYYIWVNMREATVMTITYCCSLEDAIVKKYKNRIIAEHAKHNCQLVWYVKLTCSVDKAATNLSHFKMFYQASHFHDKKQFVLKYENVIHNWYIKRITKYLWTIWLMIQIHKMLFNWFGVGGSHNFSKCPIIK